MLYAAIIDDVCNETPSLSDYLNKYPDIEVVGIFKSVAEYFSYPKVNDVNYIFIYIEMSYSIGLDIAKQINKRFPNVDTVFISENKYYAVDAFYYNAIDYVLKPLDADKVQRVVEKMRRRMPSFKTHEILIKCLGGFDIYIDGKIVPFTLAKPKEIFAFLVMNMGKSLGWMSIADEVWPDTYDDKKLMNNFHVACFSLRMFLSNKGMSELFDYGRNTYRVDTTKFKCDLVDLFNVYGNYCITGDVIINPSIFQTGEFLENLNYPWSYNMAGKIEKMLEELMSATKK